MKVLHIVLAAAATVQAGFWMGDIAHRGIAPFNPDKAYKVFRNVRDYGAKGDGVTDDTAAINAAIADGHRCIGYECVGTTTTPAVVYIPAGTYLITSSIKVHYYTQIIGDPTSMPVLKAAPSFQSSGIGLLETNQYQGPEGKLNFISTNVFFRQVRNLVLDITDARGEVSAIHWPSSQATSIQNCVFKLSTKPDDSHTGIFMEEGSGGLLNDLVFYGGKFGAQFGNQQYTMRNLTFYGAQTAILQIWNWSWMYKSLTIVDCDIGINMSAPSVGSTTILDSSFTNVRVALWSGRDILNSTSRGSLVVENVYYTNVSIALMDPFGQTLLQADPASNLFDPGYAAGNIYTPNGPHATETRENQFFIQPAGLKLVGGDEYFERSKPQYENYTLDSFLSAREHGAVGDGVADDTQALNALFKAAADSWKIAFMDAGYYRVTDTVYVPSKARIVGEPLAAVIMGAGDKFANKNSPYPVVKIGNPGEAGYVEMSDIIVSTQGATAGAVLIQYNMNTPVAVNGSGVNQMPSGMWDVHVRVGGFAGSQLQVNDCPITPNLTNYVNPSCIAAHTSMHITPKASGLYMENNWLWVADHDIEDLNMTRVSVFGGRGLLVEGSNVWLVASSVEHHTLYQYQLTGAKNIFMGQIQTETPYYQPNPPAPYPFDTRDPVYSDPDFSADCKNGAPVYADNTNATKVLAGNPPCEMAWGLRIVDSTNVVAFGVGLYSFFNNYQTNCSQAKAGENCQARLFSITGEDAHGNLEVYNLNTVGTVSMVTHGGADMAIWGQNYVNFASTVALFAY